jgi:hypothetical protein
VVYTLPPRVRLSELYIIQYRKLYLFVCQQRDRRGVLSHWSVGGAVTLHCLTIVMQQPVHTCLHLSLLAYILVAEVSIMKKVDMDHLAAVYHAFVRRELMSFFFVLLT